MRKTCKNPNTEVDDWWLGATLKDVEKVFVLFAHCNELLLWYTPGGGDVDGGGGGGGDGGDEDDGDGDFYID